MVYVISSFQVLFSKIFCLHKYCYLSASCVFLSRAAGIAAANNDANRKKDLLLRCWCQRIWHLPHYFRSPFRFHRPLLSAFCFFFSSFHILLGRTHEHGVDITLGIVELTMALIKIDFDKTEFLRVSLCLNFLKPAWWFRMGQKWM